MQECKKLGIVPQARLAPIARGIFRFLYQTLGGIVTFGSENVPRLGPVLFCPNHLSDADPSAIYVATPRQDIYFISRHDYLEWPISGPVLKAFGCIPIHRDSADRQAIRSAIGIMQTNSCLVIFPEGRESLDSKLQRIQPGAALIAIKSGAPIVPVGLERTNWILPYATPLPRHSPLPVRVIFGKPIWPSEVAHLQGRKAVNALTARLETEIRTLTGQ
jgi:1-acyl-sn-glycerol-3-phosphate acyltransferase